MQDFATELYALLYFPGERKAYKVVGILVGLNRFSRPRASPFAEIAGQALAVKAAMFAEMSATVL